MEHNGKAVTITLVLSDWVWLMALLRLVSPRFGAKTREKLRLMHNEISEAVRDASL